MQNQNFFGKYSYFRKSSHLKIAFLISVVVVTLKILFQHYGIEFLHINSLLTAIISGKIFILGFLLNSTLRDYKEAEKIPASMVTSL